VTNLRLSIVIAAYNSAKELGACLTAVNRSSWIPAECIVVVDGATDDTSVVAEQHGARVVFLQQQQGPAHARNVGARLASGDIILFLDADVCIHPDAIERLIKHFRQDASLAAVIGAYDDLPAATPFVSQYRNLLHCYTHRRGRAEAETFWAGCGAIRRDVFLRFGGLDERYGRPAIEDIEFGLRLHAAGERILLDAAIQVKHVKCWTLASMIATDVFDRGVPWTRLILRTGCMPDDLNLRWTQRLSVLTAFLSPAALAWGHPWLGLTFALALVCLNLGLFLFLRSRRGIWFALNSLPIHFLFHFYSGIAFGIGLCSHLLSASPATESEPAQEEIT